MGLPEWKCSCGAWNPLPPVVALRDRRTVVRCENCQTPQPRLLLAHVLVCARERVAREVIRLDRAGLL